MSGESPEVRRLIERCAAEGLTEVADRLARLATRLGEGDPRRRLKAAQDFLGYCHFALRGEDAAPRAGTIPDEVIEAATTAVWAEADRLPPGERAPPSPVEALKRKLVAAGMPALGEALDVLRRSNHDGDYRELAALAGRLVGEDDGAAAEAARRLAGRCHVRDLGDLSVPALDSASDRSAYGWWNLLGKVEEQVERFARKRAQKD